MPKAAKGRKAGLVEAAPMQLDRVDEEPSAEEPSTSAPAAAQESPLLPLKTKFEPLNAFDQNNRRVEFRRVCVLAQLSGAI